ncbi:MAG: hypothetical protein P8J18_00545 [Halieaceae bacterium]|nr:hypothetical protein [Halieaceae bacterium]
MQEDNKIIVEREIRRREILSLMDQDVYISRYDLPGAAKTKRFGLVDKVKSESISEGLPKNDKSADEFKMNRSKYSHSKNNKDKNVIFTPTETSEKAGQNNIAFSAIAFFSDRFLWLEDLQNNPFLEDQRQLITDINAVMEGERKILEVAKFDWPVHNNPQFDNSLEAAITSLVGFLDRLNTGFHWEKSFLLGKSDMARFNLSDSFSSLLKLSISSREMLLKPETKRVFWSELLEHVKG